MYGDPNNVLVEICNVFLGKAKNTNILWKVLRNANGNLRAFNSDLRVLTVEFTGEGPTVTGFTFTLSGTHGPTKKITIES